MEQKKVAGSGMDKAYVRPSVKGSSLAYDERVRKMLAHTQDLEDTNMSGVLTVIELTVPILRRFINFLICLLPKTTYSVTFPQLVMLCLCLHLGFSKRWIPAPEKNLDE